MSSRNFKRIVFTLAALIPAIVSASESGLELGLIRINPLSSSTPLHTELNPNLLGTAIGLSSFDSPGSKFSPTDATTLVFTAVHVFDNHFVLKIEGGIPPKFTLNGSGTVVAPGLSGAVFSIDLGAGHNRPLAKALEWSPIVLLQYRPRDATKDFQPYLGVGVGYTFFTNVKLGTGIKDDLNREFGTPLALIALKPGETTSKAHASASWVLAFNGGLSYALSDRWALVGSLSYGLVSTNARIDLKAADGTLLAQSRTNIVLNPLVVGLLLNYRFWIMPSDRQ